MSTVSCRFCQTRFSSEADSCPHCGYPISENIRKRSALHRHGETMSTVSCQFCQTKFSTEADSCPHCGYPISEDIRKRSALHRHTEELTDSLTEEDQKILTALQGCRLTEKPVSSKDAKIRATLRECQLTDAPTPFRNREKQSPSWSRTDAFPTYEQVPELTKERAGREDLSEARRDAWGSFLAVLVMGTISLALILGTRSIWLRLIGGLLGLAILHELPNIMRKFAKVSECRARRYN
ncbi:MAG: hypothetical protein ABIH23_20120 [bacterium]